MKSFSRLCLSALALAGFGVAQADDPLLLSFAVTGDTRVDPAYPKPLDTRKLPPAYLTEFNKRPTEPFPFCFNIVQLRQDLLDMAVMTPNPRYLFITGDLVMGFARSDQDTTDGHTREAILEGQLKDFLQGVHPVGVNPPELILLPGNHEMTFKTYRPDGKPITGNDDADDHAWSNWVHKNYFESRGGNGPGLDALETVNGGHKLKFDQSHMTYSFNAPDAQKGPVHFVILNTDTSTDEITSEGYETEGLIALPWVQADITAAQKNADIKEIFVLGHRPARPPTLAAAKAGTFKASDSLSAEVAGPLRQLLVQNDKVKALLVSHVHLFHADTLADHGDASTRPVQIVAGNGGVELETFWHPDKEPGMSWLPGEPHGPFFGFTLVKVYQSGKVSYNSWQRQPAVPYYGAYADMSQAPARPRSSDVVIK